MDYYNKVSRPKKLPAKKSHGSLVETSGYIPLVDQVATMINHGQNLQDYRSQRYDFADGEPDNGYTDPTRASNYDLADATRDLDLSKGMHEEAKRLKKQSDKEKAEEAKKAQEIKVEENGD